MSQDEYTKDEKALLIGRALSLARHEHRRSVGKLMDKHPDIFKDIISSIPTGEMALYLGYDNVPIKNILNQSTLLRRWYYGTPR